MQETYQTQRLLLRSSTASLAPGVADYLARNRDFMKPFEPMRQEEFFTASYQERQLVKASQENPEYCYWVSKLEEPEVIIAMVRASGIVMGAFKSCFLSYRSDKDNLRNGYMAEALDVFVNALFVELGLHRIEANIMPRNIASLATVSKLGFYEEGLARQYLKINGVWEDHIHMVRLNTLTDV